MDFGSAFDQLVKVEPIDSNEVAALMTKVMASAERIQHTRTLLTKVSFARKFKLRLFPPRSPRAPLKSRHVPSSLPIVAHWKRYSSETAMPPLLPPSARQRSKSSSRVPSHLRMR